MAYPVSNDFKTKLYSGESEFRAILSINATIIPEEQISSISISSPIIDDTKDNFYIGTFISQQLKIKFNNIDNLNIVSGQEVTLSIGQYVNNAWEDVPIGVFLIDELNENYYNNKEITCLDYAVKLKRNVDYSPCFVDGKATIDRILQYICTECDIVLNNNPNINGNVEIGTYDASISGKQWISYIAEIKGCNAKMDRYGMLDLRPIKRSSVETIDATSGSDFVLGEKYKITRVTYTDAIRNYTYGNDDNNTLFIRQDNPFISDSVVSNIYNAVKNFEIYNVKANNIGDFTLDAWDIITYDVDGTTYNTLNNNSMTYDITIMGEVNTKIPTKQQEITTNVVEDNVKSVKKFAKTEIDNVNAEISLKVGYDEVINSINLSPEEGAEIDANKISLRGKTINLTGDSIKIVGQNIGIDEDGNLKLRDTGLPSNASLTIKANKYIQTMTQGETYDLYGLLLGWLPTSFIRPSDEETRLLTFTIDDLDLRYDYWYQRDGNTEAIYERVTDIAQSPIEENIILEAELVDGLYTIIENNQPSIIDREVECTYFNTNVYDIEDYYLRILTKTEQGKTKLLSNRIRSSNIQACPYNEDDYGNWNEGDVGVTLTSTTSDGVNSSSLVNLRTTNGQGTGFQQFLMNMIGGGTPLPIQMVLNDGDWSRDILQNQVLWSGAWFMKADHTAMLSHKVSEQAHGIVLVWSRYDITNSTPMDGTWQFTFVPKAFINIYGGGNGISVLLGGNKFSIMATKYVYVSDTSIKGHADNIASGTGSGITYNNSNYVLRYVIGV